MKHFYFAGLLCVLSLIDADGQISFSANTTVPPYNGDYLFGCNAGVYSSWNIFAMADIEAGNPGRNIKGAGIKSMHQPLPEDFLTTWGYDVYLNVFAYYNRLGIKDNTIWLETPSAAHQDPTIYPGCSQASPLWSNMYTAIWDGGANGTPVNDNNYLALYVYNTVTRYKSWVKFWEIVNEPDFTPGSNGDRPSGDAGNWWDSNPTPAELTNLRAPVFNYIRALRIVYEVVKFVDPSAYVSMGGVGYSSFLDVMLRNTDNPAGGGVTSEYPLTGGAYFDCVSFHYYPMFDLGYFDNGQQKFLRYSDAAADHYIVRKNTLAATCYKRGYNDTVYPKKVFICTENNVSRKAFGNYIGGDDVQRNYDIKAAVYSQLNDIRQLYIFSIGDRTSYAAATDPFDVVGFYQDLNGKGPGENANDTVGPYLQQYTNSGIAYKTFSDLLSGFRADTVQTKALNLPAAVIGGAFKNTTGEYRYVLWAATSTDNSEAANASYSFPAALNMPPQVYQRSWDYSVTSNSPLVSSQNIPLTGSPSMISSPLIVTALKPDSVLASPAAYFALSLYPNPVKDRLIVKLHLRKKEKISIVLTDGLGQPIAQVADNSLYNAGENIIQVPIPQGTGAGMYYCRLQAGNTSQTIKFIISQ